MNGWECFGKTNRFYLWRRRDGERWVYQSTVLDYEPTIDAGYYNLSAMLALKDEGGGYRPIGECIR